MAVRVVYEDPRDAARTVDALLTAAETERARHNPLLVRKYIAMANQLGDAIDAAPVPTYNVEHQIGRVDTQTGRG